MSQFELLVRRNFLPLFTAQFLGALHDNLFKNALVVALLFKTAALDAQGAQLLTTLAAAVFILPYVLFSAQGGELATRFPKHLVIRAIKVVEAGIAVMGIIALTGGSLTLAFVTLFALGTHSAFFSPVKYSLLPEHLTPAQLVGGNALLNTGTFMAILAGTLLGTGLMALPQGEIYVSALVGLCAAAGLIAAWFIPQTTAAQPFLHLQANPLRVTASCLRMMPDLPLTLRRTILGISWFYFMGGMFLAQLPNFVHDILKADAATLTLVLVIFSLGIAAGGLLNNRLLRGRLEAVYVPVAVLGISLFSFDLYLASAVATGHLSFRAGLDIGLIALCGGLFVVPLEAILQHGSDKRVRSRVMALNAVMNALFIVASSLFSMALIAAGLDVRALFAAFAAANLAVAFYICRLMPDYLIKTVLQGALKALYRVEVRGLENYPRAGERAVIVANHVSFIDPPILAAFLPGRPMFAVNSRVARWFWVAPFLKLVDFFPLDPTSPYALKSLIRKVEENRHVVIFPEGRLTETGGLMKIYDGPGMIAARTGAMVVPVRLEGVQHTPFSRLKGKIAPRLFPRIVVTILPPRAFTVDEALRGKARRAFAGNQLYNVMEDMMFDTAATGSTLFDALLAAARRHGGRAMIAEDIDRRPLSYRRLIRGAVVLGRAISTFTGKGENVGLMLPNSAAALASFFALQAYGRRPAMINFSAGARTMAAACQTAQVKTVLTSRRFVSKAGLEDAVATLEAVARVVYLEDIRARLRFTDKLRGLLTDPARLHRAQAVKGDDPAVILFTSGSEGVPKGVVLSHGNLLSNIAQVTARVDFNRQDVVFNALPLFHSFGLTGGALLPVLSGVRTFLYPNPLHYRIIPELVYATNTTIMFGTDTFLQGYARAADPYDFYRLRYVFAGAEKVKDQTRQLYMEKFGVPILEGYGTTETAPVIAVNSAMKQKPGTVGRLMPGMSWRLEPVEGVSEGGRFYVRGPNVMLGYYKAEAPGVLQPPADGWHDTGDIVAVDEQGFIRILGRVKRFAKIAGEMVSLAQVEALAEAAWPGAQHAAVTLPDAQRGEQIVLLTTAAEAARATLTEAAVEAGLSALNVPARVMIVEALPLLGSGKVDYQAARMSVETGQGQEKRAAG